MRKLIFISIPPYQCPKISMEDPSLLALIRKYFNEDDLRIACFQIAVDYEDLPALGKTAKIMELIRFCHRNGRLPALLKTVAQERPRATWPNPDDPPPFWQGTMVGSRRWPSPPMGRRWPLAVGTTLSACGT